MIDTAVKTPDEAYSFAYRFGRKLGDATIASVVSAVSTPRGAKANMVYEGVPQISGADVLVKWAGGADLEDYLTRVKIVSSGGETLEADGIIEVRAAAFPAADIMTATGWTQADLQRLSAALAQGVKSVSFADGRKTEFQSTGEMLQLRDRMKAELAAAASQTTPRTRFSVGRVRRQPWA